MHVGESGFDHRIRSRSRFENIRIVDFAVDSPGKSESSFENKKSLLICCDCITNEGFEDNEEF